MTAIHCRMRDIHERKRAEESLSESREELQSILRVAQDPIVMIDPQGCITLWNQAAERVFGYTAEESLGRSLHTLVMPARLRDAHQTGFAEFVHTGTGAAIGKVVELPAMRKGGAEFPAELSIAAVPLRGQWYAAGIIRDITARKRDQEELQHYSAVLEAANKRLEESARMAEAATRAKTEFLANMSHEIRTPMTAILGYTDLLLDDSLDAAEHAAYLATVRRNGEHLLQLINDILDLSKIEAGRMDVEFGPCPLQATVNEVVNMMRPRAEQRGNTLAVRFRGRLPETIDTDSTRLRQVMVNLVGNAVKFTDHGRVQVDVSFLPAWRARQAAVCVAVTDTGIGIPQESLGRIFEPFTQAEGSTTRKYGGTGLGLAISRRLVAALGGELTVESTPGQGSTFTVTIPTGNAWDMSSPASLGDSVSGTSATGYSTPAADALQGVRILLAEDSLDSQMLIRTVLGRAGAEIEIANNGREAVERALAGAFDAILMDINMPELDGYEATRQLRARAYTRPILALTANAMADDCQRYLVAGCDAHIAKPIDRRHLIDTIQRVVGTSARPDAASGPDPCDAAGHAPAPDDLVAPVAAEPPPPAALAGLPPLAEGLADEVRARAGGGLAECGEPGSGLSVLPDVT